MTSTPEPTRPPGLVAAAAGSVVVGVVIVALAGASLASGHGDFSGAVGLMLLIYGVAVAAAGWGLWRLSIFARGPVLATALLHVAVAFSYSTDTPVAWVLLVISAVTAAGVVLPSTTRALKSGRVELRTRDEPPPTGAPQK